MATMIERLLGDPVFRQDAKRILPVVRPLPERPRDLLEIFSAMGGEASMISLLRSVDLRGATPGWLIFVALNRWPSMAELRAREAAYEPRKHLTELMHSVEFRTLLAQRILSAYPEKIRLLYVRIPGSGGEHFLDTVQNMHPIFPDHVANPSPRLPPDFFRALGLMLSRFLSTRTVMLVQPRLPPYYMPPAAVPAEAASEESLPWTMTIPPYRTGDRLFTIVRDPQDIVLAQVNAVVDALRARTTPEPQAIKRLPEPQAIRRWRMRLGELPDAAEAEAWAPVARRVLAGFQGRDPICHALADGTLDAALDACAVTNMEIADASRYDEWITRTWDTKPEPPALPPPPAALPREALTDEDQGRLAALTGQDRPFYARVRAALDGAELSSIKGLQL
jgi:hypothetical protein